jgi:hypothetical protein
VRAVAGGSGDPRGHRARLVDPLLENLAVLRFLVIEQLVVILRLIQLAEGGIDADLAE